MDPVKMKIMHTNSPLVSAKTVLQSDSYQFVPSDKLYTLFCKQDNE